ncbi:e3 ubiquitin-protein ligase bre1 [Stemphylium lycopersici]|nr:e3 ubiquitin-protein ligase bre1 [Stemphylium lycopersici]
MEDRKRPINEDSAPPAKRQAVTVNGARSHPDADLPWKDDLEVRPPITTRPRPRPPAHSLADTATLQAFQKDAILRQMREFKREKATVESQLSELEGRSKHHDDHLRTIDAWFDQLIDEIKLRGADQLPASSGASESSPSVPPALLCEENEIFKRHLSKRKESILASLSHLFARYPASSPEVADLQKKLSELLASEKEHVIRLQRVATEKEQLSDRLDTATHRYLVAEKKLDRLKSAQVQKLEQQAVGTSAPAKEEAPSASNGTDAVNGTSPGPISEELETTKNQAIAEAAKRKQHLEQIEQENKKLTEEVSALRVKLTGLSDDDYAKTDLFKAIKSQHEDVIKRINNLEAQNISLREEAQKNQAERTAYRIKVDEEVRTTLAEHASHVSQAEANCARIRNARDELVSKNNVLEASHKDSKESIEQTKQLMSACDSRIAALESECERLRLQISEQQASMDQESSELDNLTPEQLRAKVLKLESQAKILSNELPSMESAWKKAQAIASKKIADIASWEENIAKANADKAKADQKFFAAMKTKGELEQQIRILHAQSRKATEVVSQLKEADSLSRSLVDKLEKQTAEMRSQMDELSVQHRQLQQKVNENSITAEGQVSQIAELKKLVEAKDATCTAAKHAQRESETERDKLAAQVTGLEKQVQIYKKKSTANQSSEVSTMELLIQCQICKSKLKNTVIKTCGHMFCDHDSQPRERRRSKWVRTKDGEVQGPVRSRGVGLSNDVPNASLAVAPRDAASTSTLGDDYYNHHNCARRKPFKSHPHPPTCIHCEPRTTKQKGFRKNHPSKITARQLQQPQIYPIAMSPNVLASRDTNAQVKPMSSPENDAEKKDIKSLDYHRKVLQSRLNHEQEQKYISPSDDIQSPATQKLAAFKAKHAMKKSKPQTLFKKTSSKNFESTKSGGDTLMFADIPKDGAKKDGAEA